MICHLSYYLTELLDQCTEVKCQINVFQKGIVVQLAVVSMRSKRKRVVLV